MSRIDELALLAQNGNQQAYGELIDEIHGLFRYLATGMSHSDSMIDDLVSEGIYSLFSSVPAWKPEKGKFSSFACQCASNQMKSYLRSQAIYAKRLAPSTYSPNPACEPDPNERPMRYEDGEYHREPGEDELIPWEDIKERGDTACAASEAVMKQDASQRDMVQMFLSGAKLDDIAEMLVQRGHIKAHLPVAEKRKAVRSRLQRSLEMIKVYIQSIDPDLASKISVTDVLSGKVTEG